MRAMFEIEVKYNEDKSEEELIRKFNSFGALGVWVANNYDQVRIVDLIQFDE